MTAADEALNGVKYARATIEAGFTTVRNVGAANFTDIALMHAIDRGDIEGPRIVPAAHAIGITGGHCDVTGFAPGIAVQDPLHGVADGIDQVVQAVRLQIKYGAQVIKICATAGVLSYDATVGAQQLSEAEMRAIVEEATRHGLKVAAHAHGTEGIKAAIRAGVASIEHGSMLDDEAIALMKQHGTYLVPTRALADLLDRNNLPPAIRLKMDQVMPLADALVPEGRCGRRQDRLRHRRCGAAARDEREGVQQVHSGRHVTARRDSHRDTQRRRPAWKKRPRRDRRGKACGPRRGARRSAGRHHGNRARDVRDEGRPADPVVRYYFGARVPSVRNVRTESGPVTV